MDDHVAEGPANAPRTPWVGPTSLMASTVGSFVVVALLLGGPGVLDEWLMVPFVPGLVGLALLAVRAVRTVAVGLAATLLLPLTLLALGLANRVPG